MGILDYPFINMHKEPTQHDSGEVRWWNAGRQKLLQADDAYS